MRKSLRQNVRSPRKLPDMSWVRLYEQALQRAEERSDPRLQDLRHYGANPEAALRRLSIISQVDLDREFPRLS